MKIYVLMVMIAGNPYPVGEFTGKIECQHEMADYKFQHQDPNAELFCVEK